MARDLHNTTLKVQIFMWDGRPVRKFFSGILDKKDWSMGLVKVRGQEGLQPRIFLTKPCAGCVSWGDLVQLGHEGGVNDVEPNKFIIIARSKQGHKGRDMGDNPQLPTIKGFGH